MVGYTCDRKGADQNGTLLVGSRSDRLDPDIAKYLSQAHFMLSVFNPCPNAREGVFRVP